MDNREQIDWTDCSEVERIPGKVSGQPVIKATRILADSVVEAYEMGCTPEEIAEDFPTINRAFADTPQTDIVRRVVAHAHRHQPQP